MLKFVCRVRAGTERRTLAEAAQRVHSAWLPFSLESTRKRRKRDAVATVRPIMPYMFCEADHHDGMMRLFQHRDIFSTAWFIPVHQEKQINEYRARVQDEFERNRRAYLTDTRAFHCAFKPGQVVQLRNAGLELFSATFRAIHEDGRYELEADMLGQSVPVLAEPHRVTA